MTLIQLQKAIEKVMVTDMEMHAKLQAGLMGIGSLAKETRNLTVNRDVSGATCINQYVVVKTLGRGSYGKVKLCLNTVDGHLYAIKMMNRTFLLRSLQRPKATLRKSARRASSAQALQQRTAAGAAAGAGGGGQEGAQQSSNIGAGAAAAGGNPAAGSGKSVCGAASSMPSLKQGFCSREIESMDEVSREIAILKKLDHPNVVKLYEVRRNGCVKGWARFLAALN
jgi:serine/threonine protein kinase